MRRDGEILNLTFSHDLSGHCFSVSCAALFCPHWHLPVLGHGPYSHSPWSHGWCLSFSTLAFIIHSESIFPARLISFDQDPFKDLKSQISPFLASSDAFSAHHLSVLSRKHSKLFHYSWNTLTLASVTQHTWFSFHLFKGSFPFPLLILQWNMIKWSHSMTCFLTLYIITYMQVFNDHLYGGNCHIYKSSFHVFFWFSGVHSLPINMLLSLDGFKRAQR